MSNMRTLGALAVLVGCSGAVAEEPDVTGAYRLTVTSTCSPSQTVPVLVTQQPDGRIGLAHPRLANSPCVGDLLGSHWVAECQGARYELDFQGGTLAGIVTSQGCVSQVRGVREAAL